MAFDAQKLNALQILKSSGGSGGDCLGGVVSMQRAHSFAPLIISDELNALEILYVSPCILPGTGHPLLRAISMSITGDTAEDEYYLTCEGEDGDPVEIAVGDTAVLAVEADAPSGTHYNYCVVRRLDTGTSGTVTFRAAPCWNNAIAMNDVDYGGSDYQYRCVFLWATEALTISYLNPSGGVAYSYEGEALITDIIADGETDPGLVWTTSATSPSIALSAGTGYSFWLRSTPTGQGLQGACLAITYTIGGDVYSLSLTGLRRIPDTTQASYILYEADDTDTAGGSAVATSATLPFTYDTTPPVAGTEERRYRVTRKNKYGVESQNRYLVHSLVIDDDGDDATAPPAVTGLSVTATAEGYAEVEWDYSDAQGYSHATRFVLTVDDGTTELTHTTANFGEGAFIASLGPFRWGEVASVSVVAYDELDRASADASTSIRLDAASDYAAYVSDGIVANTSQKTAWGNPASDTVGTLTTIGGGGIVLWIEGTYGPMLAYSIADRFDQRALYAFALVNEDLTANAGTDPIEVSGDKVYLCAGGNRCAEFDTTNATLKARRFSNILNECPVDDGIYETGDRTYFQIADMQNNRMRTWLCADKDGTLYLPLGVIQQ